MMFFVIVFYWSAMDGHSKRDGLEKFNMKLEKCYYSISFLKPAANWSIIYDF